MIEATVSVFHQDVNAEVNIKGRFAERPERGVIRAYSNIKFQIDSDTGN